MHRIDTAFSFFGEHPLHRKLFQKPKYIIGTNALNNREGGTENE